MFSWTRKGFQKAKNGVRVFLLLKISIIFDYTIFHFECGHFVSHFLFGPGLNLSAELSLKKNLFITDLLKNSQPPWFLEWRQL